MKTIGFLFVSILIFVSCFTSCTSSKPTPFTTATVTVPPLSIKDFQNIGFISVIEPRLEIVGDIRPNDIIPIYKYFFSDHLTCELAKQLKDKKILGKYMLDFPKDLLNSQGYGWPEIPQNNNPDATIQAIASIDITSEDISDSIVMELKSYKFDIENNGTMPSSVPSDSNPLIEEYSGQNIYKLINAKAKLTWRISDKNNRLIYTKNYELAPVEKKIEHISGQSDIAENLFGSAIKDLIKDLSSKKEKRPVYINDKGDPTSVWLMKAGDYIDAKPILEKAIAQNEERYRKIQNDKEKLYQGKGFGVSKEYPNPEDQKAQFIKLDKRKNTALAQERLFMSPDYQNFATVLEILGYATRSAAYYEKARTADPSNFVAIDGCNRLIRFRETTSQEMELGK